jgi:hypothetical protein
LDSDSEEGSFDKPDFCELLQRSDLPIQHTNPSVINLEDVSSLKGTKDSSEFLGMDNSPVPDLNSIEVHSHNIMTPPDFRLNGNLVKTILLFQKFP